MNIFTNKYFYFLKKNNDYKLINDNDIIKVYIRKELNENEKRTIIVPSDIKKLKNNNFKIYIESSDNRIYENNLYENSGAIVTYLKWYDDYFKNALIIGLKDFEDYHMLQNHIHIYFSHSYKNQYNSSIILNSFKMSSSLIYDLEYFKNKSGKRLISFGFYAGYVGGSLGIMQYYNKKNHNRNISNLKYWYSKKSIKDELIQLINEDNIKNGDNNLLNKYTTISKNKNKNNNNNNNNNNIKIGIIGPKGNCGNGVIDLLNSLGIEYINITKDNINLFKLNEFDILFNCILLEKNYNNVWFNKETIFRKNIIIVDISCDFTKENNPIQIYDKNTTFKDPVYNYNKYVDIIAIDNLPSLLPKDSSDYFSEKFSKLLIEYRKDSNYYWKNNKKVFLNVISNIDILHDY